MGRPKGPKKDKFDVLSDAFKDSIQQNDIEGIKKKISEIAVLESEMRQTLKDDPEVCSAKESLKNLMEPYREDLKAFKLQVQYAIQVMKDKGGA